MGYFSNLDPSAACLVAWAKREEKALGAVSVTSGAFPYGASRTQQNPTRTLPLN
jgi:hypothetical protein